jgi:phenylalanyl-tRNA synthetase beta chain
MKFTLSWLKEHLETRASCADIVHALDSVGLEVERVIAPREDLKDFKIVRVISVAQHPNADRLRVCTVTTGSETIDSIVCGASNVRNNLCTVLALPGMGIPYTGKVLTPATIRGVESKGMLCSAVELNLGEESEGILDLGDEAPLGVSIMTFKGLDDPVIEISVTPNRGDALGVRGIARDLAAYGLGTLKALQSSPLVGEGACSVSVLLPEVGDEPPCWAFAMREIRGVTNGSSPQWMQNRLHSVGLRSISRLVDITNYITVDQGRPLHVFDRSKIRGSLTVRFAQEGETLQALNGHTYTLDPSILVIADADGVQSIAGIMGGAGSGCTDATTDVLIESALWDPKIIARAGRKLGLTSDARHRFERGVDREAYLYGLHEATERVVQLCGGSISEVIDVCPLSLKDRKAQVLLFSWAEVERLTGVPIGSEEGTKILSSLGFSVNPKSSEEALITIPSWRFDIQGQADLVEEIMRIAGLHRIPSVPLPPLPHVRELPVSFRKARRARQVLSARGLNESITWSFISVDQASHFGGGDASLTLANPLSPQLACLRPSLIPGLLQSACQNQNRGMRDIGLFEIGSIFSSSDPEGQQQSLCGLRGGMACESSWGRNWREAGRTVSVFDVKSDLETLLRTFNYTLEGLRLKIEDAPSWYHPGRYGALYQNTLLLGRFGELHPLTAQAFDLKETIALFEVNLNALNAISAPKSRKALRLSDLQPLSRDFAFVIDRAMPVATVVRAVRTADRALIEDVQVFDVYEGEGIAPQKRSIALSVTFQPFEKTLTEAEIEALSQRIIHKVAEHAGGTLRI